MRELANGETETAR